MTKGGISKNIYSLYNFAYEKTSEPKDSEVVAAV